MVSHAALEFVFLVLGYIFTGALYLSPIPTIWRICSTGNVGQYKSDMLIATLGSCLVWLLYGIPHPFSMAIVIINGVGILIEAIYIGIYLFMLTPGNRRIPSMFTILVIAAVGLFASVVFPLFKNPRAPLGILGDLSSAAMYAGPVRQMIAVWNTKDTEDMSLWVTGTSLGSGISWTVYACLIGDRFILIPNAFGIVSGLVQVAFYVVIKRFYQPAAAAAAAAA